MFVIVVSTGNLWAQQALSTKPIKSAEDRASAYTNRMTKKLNLDATQVERFKVLNIERFQQLQTAREMSGADKKQIGSKVKEINEAYFANAKGILTPEQFMKFQELNEEMKEKAMARKANKKE